MASESSSWKRLKLLGMISSSGAITNGNDGTSSALDPSNIVRLICVKVSGLSMESQECIQHYVLEGSRYPSYLMHSSAVQSLGGIGIAGYPATVLTSTGSTILWRLLQVMRAGVSNPCSFRRHAHQFKDELGTDVRRLGINVAGYYVLATIGQCLIPGISPSAWRELSKAALRVLPTSWRWMSSMGLPRLLKRHKRKARKEAVAEEPFGEFLVRVSHNNTYTIQVAVDADDHVDALPSLPPPLPSKPSSPRRVLPPDLPADENKAETPAALMPPPDTSAHEEAAVGGESDILLFFGMPAT